MQHFFILLLPGILGGIINAIAGGGGIVMYPALLASGLNPLNAGATLALVVWPGSASSAYGYREELRKLSRYYWWLLVPCVLGSIIGNTILIHTHAATFEKIAPWLILVAVLLLALQARIQRWLAVQTKKRKIHWHNFPLICLAAFPLAIYAGFFGVGYGLTMLALLGFAHLKTMHQMNGLKNLCGIAMALVSTIYFTHAGLINWPAGLVMAGGTFVGGYAGARLSRKVSSHLVHDLTVVLGLGIVLYLLLKG